MKEKIKKIKEMAKNPRKKALLQLGAWILFFFISYIIIILLPHPTPKYSSPSNSNSVDSISQFQEMENFEYTYTFSYQGKREQIVGTYFDKKYYFTYLGKEYYSALENIYQVNSTNKTFIPVDNFIINLSLKELSIDSLTQFMKDGILIEEKEYKDGKKVSNYEYIKDGKKIIMAIVEKDKYIREVSLDLKEYMSNANITYDNFQVELEFNEINNLSSYSKNYLDYQVVLEGE